MFEIILKKWNIAARNFLVFSEYFSNYTLIRNVEKIFCYKVKVKFGNIYDFF